ncbi:hypothetical protein K474DRAFT_701943 [Panus rudis PR-1116 ss-1]|nr:hypothetical protein K474DRAFT_734564 [Panus rudis PR-1116 ss-1]KAI0070938.1 hypothetical protein K474DRAFT_701943 [Panus rudis PR-1116 ss-1]
MNIVTCVCVHIPHVHVWFLRKALLHMRETCHKRSVSRYVNCCNPLHRDYHLGVSRNTTCVSDNFSSSSCNLLLYPDPFICVCVCPCNFARGVSRSRDRDTRE